MVITDAVAFCICTVRKHLATYTDESIPQLDIGTIVQDEIVETHFGTETRPDDQRTVMSNRSLVASGEQREQGYLNGNGTE